MTSIHTNGVSAPDMHLQGDSKAYRVPEAAERLGLSKSQLYNLLDDGELRRFIRQKEQDEEERKGGCCCQKRGCRSLEKTGV